MAAHRRLRRIDLFFGRLLVEARLQRGTGLEASVSRRRDFNFLASRRVAPFSGGALAHGERAESDEPHFLALPQGVDDALQHSLERGGGGNLGQFRLRGDMIDELKLVHYGLSVRLRRSVFPAPILKSGAFNAAASGTSRRRALIPVRPPRRRSSPPQANR